MRTLRVASMLIAVLLIVQLVRFPAHAAMPQQDPVPDVVSGPLQPQGRVLNSQEVTDYWTPERMDAAQPSMPLRSTAAPPSSSERDFLADGPPMLVNSRFYGGAESAAYSLTYPNGSNQVPAWTYPFPFNRGYVTFPRTNSVHGKLFYTQLGSDFTCSGTAVTTGGGNESLVLTAAHCLHAANNDDSGYSYNVLFQPALGAYVTFGTWSGSDAFIPGSWYASGNLREDFGFVVLYNDGSNACGTIGDCIGGMGLAWNQPIFQEFWTFGYPASPFSGVDLAFCAASTATQDNAPGTGALPLGMGCDMTGGASGGAWTLGAKWGNAGGHANSVTSYKLVSPSQPKAVYGPYFASSFGTLWNAARVAVAPPPP